MGVSLIGDASLLRVQCGGGEKTGNDGGPADMAYGAERGVAAAGFGASGSNFFNYGDNHQRVFEVDNQTVFGG